MYRGKVVYIGFSTILFQASPRHLGTYTPQIRGTAILTLIHDRYNLSLFLKAPTQTLVIIAIYQAVCCMA